MLIGNKSDIKDKREVMEVERLKFALNNSCESFETSCADKKDISKISKAFETLIRITLDEIESIDSKKYRKKIASKEEKIKRKNICFIQ